MTGFVHPTVVLLFLMVSVQVGWFLLYYFRFPVPSLMVPVLLVVVAMNEISVLTCLPRHWWCASAGEQLE